MLPSVLDIDEVSVMDPLVEALVETDVLRELETVEVALVCAVEVAVELPVLEAVLETVEVWVDRAQVRNSESRWVKA